MLFTLKRLSLGLLLIAGVSAILLLSDVDRRRPAVDRLPRVAHTRSDADRGSLRVPVDKTWKISLISFADSPSVEEIEQV